MPSMKRPVRFTFQMTESEMAEMSRRAESLGIRNLSAYARKMVLNGFILQLDIPEMKEMVSLMKYAGNNINQIAKVANTTGIVYENDLKLIQTQLKGIWECISRINLKMVAIEK